MSKKKVRNVVVTTDSSRRGVFMGELKEYDLEKQTATIENLHMCVYWSSETKGVLGLAAHGPQDGSKVTPMIPKMELNGVTSVMDMNDEAVKKWRETPWG